MGIHSFEIEPDHCAVYRAIVGEKVPVLHGLSERWNMPAAQHRRAIGKNVHFKGVPHYVLTYHTGGARAHRTDGFSGATGRRGALSLQRPHSGSTISSDGVVNYSHLYFKQSLLCEVTDEMDRKWSPEPDDFFASFDTSLSRDIDAYLERAVDTNDPPTPIEMDNRAYLIALGVLRIAQNGGATITLRDDSDMRVDLRQVLQYMDDNLGEPLRLSGLAEIVRMSPFHFARVFRQHIGEPPAQHLRRRRTERAIELLRNGQLSISEIAFRTGFASQSHLSNRVKAVTGLTPGQIRAGD